MNKGQANNEPHYVGSSLQLGLKYIQSAIIVRQLSPVEHYHNTNKPFPKLWKFVYFVSKILPELISSNNSHPISEYTDIKTIQMKSI